MNRESYFLLMSAIFFAPHGTLLANWLIGVIFLVLAFAARGR